MDCIIAHDWCLTCLTTMEVDKTTKDNFMDFSEPQTELFRSVHVCRPQLITEKHIIYEDESRTTQVLNEMHRFYQDERWCDVVLLAEEGSRFPCHRLVLAASSLYFEKMFTNGMCEQHATEITLNQISSCALKHLLEFAYTSKLSVNKDTVLEIFEAADMLQFTSARKFCQDFLLEQIDHTNCLIFMVYADAFSCELLYDRAKLCAATEFKALCDTHDFYELPKKQLIALLEDDNIVMEYEEHVYEAMRAWVMHDKPHRAQNIAELLRCIRLNFISRWYLIEKISHDELVSPSSEAVQFIQDAKDQLLAQGHTYEIPWQLPPSRKCTGLTSKIVYVCTYDPNPQQSEVCLFDVVNKSWSNTSHTCPLASELSTCENVGDALLVVGGWNNSTAPNKSMNLHGAVNKILEFKVMSQIFPTLWFVGAHSMGLSRYLHSSIAARQGQDEVLFLCGGYDDSQNLQSSLCVTDASRQYRFSPCAPMFHPLARPALALWQGEKIYAFGGFGEGGVPKQFIQCYDIEMDQWTEIKPGIHGAYVTCQYAVCIDGVLYVLCGTLVSPHGLHNNMVGHLVPERIVDSVCTFNPILKSWDTVFRFPEPRCGAFSVTTLDGKIYISGGTVSRRSEPSTPQSPGSSSTQPTTLCPHFVVDVYNPESNSLETVTSTREASLTLCTTMRRVMHENFGL